MEMSFNKWMKNRMNCIEEHGFCVIEDNGHPKQRKLINRLIGKGYKYEISTKVYYRFYKE